MKTRKRIAAIVVTALLTVGMTLNFSGCSKESPTGFSNSEKENTNISMSKAIGFKLGNTENMYPQSSSRVLTYINNGNCWQGGNIIVPGGTTFHLMKGALIPPQGTKAGEPVIMTMLAEKNQETGVLEFTFGPSGCRFDPPAVVLFDYTDLNSNGAKLYYIESDGTYSELQPEQVDNRNFKMMLKIDHFSRYALAHSE